MTPSRAYLSGHWPLLLALSVLVAVVVSILAVALTDGSDADPAAVADVPSVEAGDSENRDDASGGQAQADEAPVAAEPAEAGNTTPAGTGTGTADEGDNPPAEAETREATQPASSDVSESTANPDEEEVGAAPDEAPDEAEVPGDDESPADAPSIAPELLVDPSQIRQGETVLVRLRGVEAGAAWLTVDGVTTVMVDEAGVWVGFVPVPPLSELGAYTVIVDLFDDGGSYVDTVLGEFSVINV